MPKVNDRVKSESVTRSPRPISERLWLQLEDMWLNERLCGGKKQIFGRWFMDRYQPGVNDPEIYYCSHVRFALKRILERYVK